MQQYHTGTTICVFVLYVGKCLHVHYLHTQTHKKTKTKAVIELKPFTILKVKQHESKSLQQQNKMKWKDISEGDGTAALNQLGDSLSGAVQHTLITRREDPF